MILSFWMQKIRHILNNLLIPSTKDLPVIDGLRGISILMILLFHSFYGVLFVIKGFEPILSFLNTIPTFFGFVTGSDKAVDIFFVISAFLLGSSIFKKLERDTSFNRSDILKFYAKRLVRIYPLFLLGIILYFPINVKQSLRNLPYNLLFIDNFDFRCIIPVGWSLSIEMQFYFVLPFLARALYRFAPKNRLLILLFLCLLSVIFGMIVCWIYPEIYQNHFYNFHPDFINPTTMMDRLYYPTHTRYGPLMLGLIWAFCAVHKPFQKQISELFSKHQNLQSLFIATGIFLMYSMMYFPVYKPQSLYYEYFYPQINLVLHSSHRVIFCLGLLMIVFPIYFCENNRVLLVKFLTKFLSLRIFRPFSQIVFPVYLFHFPMIALAGLAVFQTTNTKAITSIHIYDVFKIFFLAAIFSLIFGTLLHILIEKPLIIKGYSWIENKLISKSKHLESL